MSKTPVPVPVRPSVPFTPVDPDYPPGYLSGPNADGACKLWGVAEAVAIARDFARKHAGQSVAKSANGFADNIEAVYPVFQVQSAADDFSLTDQQSASLYDGGRMARMYGAGMDRWRVAQHADLSTGKSSPVLGGAFSNANYDAAGNMVYAGVTVDQVADIMFNALVADVKMGAYVVGPTPG